MCVCVCVHACVCVRQLFLKNDQNNIRIDIGSGAVKLAATKTFEVSLHISNKRQITWFDPSFKQMSNKPVT